MFKHFVVRLSAALTALGVLVVVGASQAWARRPVDEFGKDDGTVILVPFKPDEVVNWSLVLALVVGVIAIAGLAYSMGYRQSHLTHAAA
jgi:hypothetical protein